jgi:hypothetical protein
MAICNEQNLRQPLPVNKPFGIRVRLRKSDPFRNLVGGDWQKEHWFATARERLMISRSCSETSTQWTRVMLRSMNSSRNCAGEHPCGLGFCFQTTGPKSWSRIGPVPDLMNSTSSLLSAR